MQITSHHTNTYPPRVNNVAMEAHSGLWELVAQPTLCLVMILNQSLIYAHSYLEFFCGIGNCSGYHSYSTLKDIGGKQQLMSIPVSPDIRQLVQELCVEWGRTNTGWHINVPICESVCNVCTQQIMGVGSMGYNNRHGVWLCDAYLEPSMPTATWSYFLVVV